MSKLQEEQTNFSETNYEIAVTMVLSKRLIPIEFNSDELERIQKGVIDGDFQEETIKVLSDSIGFDKNVACIFLAFNAYVINYAIELGEGVLSNKKVELPKLFRTSRINRDEYLSYVGASKDDSDADSIFETSDVIKIANQAAVEILNDKNIAKRIVQVYDVLLNKRELEDKYSEILKILKGVEVMKKQKYTGFIID